MTPESEFWSRFSTKAAELHRQISGRTLRSAFDEIEKMLTRSGFNFAFDVTSSTDGDAVLILTPEGDPRVAQAIDQLIAAAPSVEGWKFFGRRQKKPVIDAVAFVQRLYGRDISDAKVLLDSAGGLVDVTMFSEAMTGLTEEEQEGLVMTFLDHAVGEDRVMAKVRSVKGAPKCDIGPRLMRVDDAVSALLRD